MAEMTFNSNAGGDGLVYSVNTNYTTAHNATSGTLDATSTPNTCAQNGITGADYYIGRGFFPFDTSTLPDDATITAATLELYITGIGDSTANYASVVQSTQASNTALNAADFDAVGTTTGGDSAAFNTLSTSAYTTITLNATGRGWISKTGYTTLALRQSTDITSSAPASFQYIQCNYSESGSNKPILRVTYTVPEAGQILTFV